MSIRSLVYETKKAVDILKKSEIDIEEKYGAGTVLKIFGDEHCESRVGIICKVPGLGYTVMNIDGVIASLATCMECGETGSVQIPIDDETRQELPYDEDNDDDPRNVLKYYDLLSELYEEVQCDSIGKLSDFIKLDKTDDKQS